eukprot:jgi/Tetstr1/433145/TSEL_022477.t1
MVAEVEDVAAARPALEHVGSEVGVRIANELPFVRCFKDNGAVLACWVAIKAALSLDESYVDTDCDPSCDGIEYQPARSSMAAVSKMESLSNLMTGANGLSASAQYFR